MVACKFKIPGKNQNYLGNFDKLVMIVMTIKEWLLPKNLQKKKTTHKEYHHG